MQEEFCYLNKYEHSYDWRIVEFDRRNEKEYMTISARVILLFLPLLGYHQICQQ